MITPNGIELAMLGGSDNPDQAANNLLESGCESVLATGGHGTGVHIINTLYNHAPDPMRWEVERIGGEYHGTGCTLAAAICSRKGLGPVSTRGHLAGPELRPSRHTPRVGRWQRPTGPDRGILWER